MRQLLLEFVDLQLITNLLKIHISWIVSVKDKFENIFQFPNQSSKYQTECAKLPPRVTKIVHANLYSSLTNHLPSHSRGKLSDEM